MRVFLFLLLLIGGACAVFFYQGEFFERGEPLISFSQIPKGIGSDPSIIQLQASDTGTGLDEVVVRAEQLGKRIDIATFKVSNEDKRSVSKSIEIHAKDLGFREGEVKITATAFDRGFFSNKQEVSQTLPIDFQKLKITVITPQQNVILGGSELVFFRVTGGTPSKVGIRVGKDEFSGYRASESFKALNQFKDLYYSFFVIPTTRTTEVPEVFVQNKVGNETKSGFPFLVVQKKFPELKIKIDDSFFEKTVSTLLEKQGESLKVTPLERAEQFRGINETLRATLQVQIKKLMSAGASSPYGSYETFFGGSIARPIAGAPKSSYSERRSYIYNNEVISKSIHDGIDLAGTAMIPVMAAQDGKVIFADYLGIYGNTVIIDHGCGFFTLYGHLSSIDKEVGSSVKKLETIGRTGATGLAGGDHLHFEIRHSGVPTTPIEWWDASWVSEHIEKKLKFVLEQMNAQSALEAAVANP